MPVLHLTTQKLNLIAQFGVCRLRPSVHPQRFKSYQIQFLSYTEFCWNITSQLNSEYKEFLYNLIVAQMGKKFSAFMKPATSITVASCI